MRDEGLPCDEPGLWTGRVRVASAERRVKKFPRRLIPRGLQSRNMRPASYFASHHQLQQCFSKRMLGMLPGEWVVSSPAP